MTLSTRPLFLLSLLCISSTVVFALNNKYCQLSCDYGTQLVSHTVCDRNEEKCGPHPRCGPNFKIVKLTDPMRQYVLDIHNYFRNWVAVGNETVGNQPPAANMMAMSYNKELEFIAQCWANTCNGKPLIHDECRRTEKFEHVGQNLGYLNSSEPITDIYKSMKDLILLWYKEVHQFQNNWVSNTQPRSNVVVGHYTQMLWASTSELGCAVAMYADKDLYVEDRTWHQLILVCNYGPGGNYLGAPMYKIGKPQTECPEGQSPHPYYIGLCGPIHRASEVKRIRNIFEL